jgi:ATP-dependent Clp protease adaptor protein ClpS
MSKERHQRDDTNVVLDRKVASKVKPPRMYKVLLHNDDYTTMEFVVAILETVFHHSNASAMQIMLHIHQNGVGVAGVFTYEVAESKVTKVMTLARENKFPLLCTCEPE